MMVSARSYARIHGYHWNTVYHWIHEDLIPHQVTHCPIRHRYFIAVNEKPPSLSPGPAPDPARTFCAGLESAAVQLHHSIRVLSQ